MTNLMNLYRRLSKPMGFLFVGVMGCSSLLIAMSSEANAGNSPQKAYSMPKKLVFAKDALANCLKAGLRTEQCQVQLSRQTPVSKA